MQVRLRLLQAVGKTLTGVRQPKQSAVSWFVQESICCGSSADGDLFNLACALPTQSANSGAGSWVSSGFLRPSSARDFRSGGPEISATDGSPVVGLETTAHSPSVDGQHDGDTVETGPHLEEDSGSPEVSSGESHSHVEVEVATQESTAGPGLYREHGCLEDSVVQEIRDRLARRKRVVDEDVPVEVVESIVQDLRDKVADKDAELDVAERVLKQAYEFLETDGYIPETEQRSLSVAVVGAPNAGKSALTNQLVGSKVSAVSRKTNTTHSDHLGVYTKGDTQLVIYDTPGLTMYARGYPIRSSRIAAVNTAWQMAGTCEAVVVVVDAHRHIGRADLRVERLVQRLADEEDWEKKKVLCLNKVDLITDKKSLLPLAKKFDELAHFDSIFMISSATGSGVKDVRNYLLDQAALRIWEYEPNKRVQKLQEDLAMEVVREHLYNNLNEEVPYNIGHHHVSWETRNDGSIRIEQHFVVPKNEHKKILIGKRGSLIRYIGTCARLDLQKLLDCTVHLILDVRTKGAYPYERLMEA